MSMPKAIRMKPEPASVLKLSEEYPLSRAISSSLAATRMRVNKLPTEVTVGPQWLISILLQSKLEYLSLVQLRT